MGAILETVLFRWSGQAIHLQIANDDVLARSKVGHAASISLLDVASKQSSLASVSKVLPSLPLVTRAFEIYDVLDRSTGPRTEPLGTNGNSADDQH